MNSNRNDQQPAGATLAEMAHDHERNQRLRFQVGAVHADFSRQRIDQAGIDAMLALAGRMGVEQLRAALEAGEAVNTTERRSALHHALRATAVDVAEHPVVARAQQAAADAAGRVQALSQRLRVSGFGDGHALTDVINVGIGGSDLGPRLLDAAIGGRNAPNLHFVSSVDAHRAVDLMAQLDPQSTAIVLVSKSFATEETLLNGRLFLDWMRQSMSADAVRLRLFAVTANVPAAGEFGVDAAHCLPIWDWVGGRYSLWSAVGFSFVLAHGFETFSRLLAGARSMDRHFFTTPLASNLPVMRALIEHWNRTELAMHARCVVPYDVRLAYLPAYLQQLEMESNGKSVRLDGTPVTQPTAPVVWGGVGTDVQHAFFQALHQGTNVVPVEFIGVIKPAHGFEGNHQVLLANLLAQSAALALGHDARGGDDPLASHKVHPGNRPGTVLLLDALTPESLGALIAMYEHSVFVEACLVGINPFDQWGVELGKRIARAFLPALTSSEPDIALDPVTRALISVIKSR